MDSKTPRKGSCLCGGITLQLDGEPSMKVLCHCESCQKASGVVFQSNVFYPKENFHLSDPKGLLKRYEDNSSDSERVIHRSFCRNCGSTISNQNPTHPEMSKMVIIPIGILDGDKESLEPNHEFYIKRRVGWQPKLSQTMEYLAME